MHLHTIHFGDRDLAYSLCRSVRKQLRIVVTPELRVEVFAPLAASDDQVRSAVREKAAWIAGKLDELAAFHPLPTPRQYISGESLTYLGRRYRLQVTARADRPAKLKGAYLCVGVEKKGNREAVRAAVDAWYRQAAGRILECHLKKCLVIAGRHGIAQPTTMIRPMQRRWGSCSPAGRITLNLMLVQVPVHCIEYVIMHELCHLKHRNHSRLFFSLLTRCQPDWRLRKATLDSFRLS
jgi:predicted metal-dependent hydrolase